MQLIGVLVVCLLHCACPAPLDVEGKIMLDSFMVYRAIHRPKAHKPIITTGLPSAGFTFLQRIFHFILNAHLIIYLKEFWSSLFQ